MQSRKCWTKFRFISALNISCSSSEMVFLEACVILQYFSQGRRTVSDFGMAISIFAMTVLDYSIKDVYTQKMPELSKLKPTRDRDWFVSPAGIPTGWMFAAVIPAVFVSILLFMETELTGIVLNKKENNLKKGAGYNLDLLVVGLVCGLCSFMGLPWICAAPVRSVSHKNSLTVMSTSHAPGERAYVVKVIEQRVTNIFIHIFIGKLEKRHSRELCRFPPVL